MKNYENRVAPMFAPVEVPETAEAALTASQQLTFVLMNGDSVKDEPDDWFPGFTDKVINHIEMAFCKSDKNSLTEVHKILFQIYEINFLNPLSQAVKFEQAEWLHHIKISIEKKWIEYELKTCEPMLPQKQITENPQALSGWLAQYAETKNTTDQKLETYLENFASLEEFLFFIKCDATLNYRFYDVIVLSQTHYSEEIKAELAAHLWDEVGAGDIGRAHTRQLTRSLKSIGIHNLGEVVWNDWRPFAGYNLYLLLCYNRQHYFKNLGSLAMPELFDVGRDTLVINGLERLGFNAKKDFEFYYNHMIIDVEHGAHWLKKIVEPVVRNQPTTGREFALGAIMRMEAMRRYNAFLYERYNISSSLEV